MLKQNLRAKSLKPYQAFTQHELISRLEHIGRNLADKKIYEINSTALGGGVAELLHSQIPLARGLDIDAHWLVIPPDDKFFGITKGLHNSLQGESNPEELDLNYYKSYSDKIAADLPLDGDIYVLHDPQTLGLIKHLAAAGKPILWRCHIDLTQADPEILSWVNQQLSPVSQIIISLDEFGRGLDQQKLCIIPPSIDPLSPKNHPLSHSTETRLLSTHGIDLKKPYITQVSRFDRFKQPLAVIDLYEAALTYSSDLQLVLAGGVAVDDPEGAAMGRAIAQRAKQSTGNVIILDNPNDLVINSLQSRAAAVIQYSSREGFGLTVTEALWKKTLVMARPVGGISLQLLPNQTGIAATGNIKHDAELLVDSLADRHLTQQLKTRAHEHVRKNFITPVMLLAYLQAYDKTLSKHKDTASENAVSELVLAS